MSSKAAVHLFSWKISKKSNLLSPQNDTLSNCKNIHRESLAWSTNAVLGILNNETYTGKLIWNKRGEAIKLENCFDPIIDEDSFHKVKTILQSRQFDSTNPNIYRSEYLFHALIKCECGASIHGASANGNGGKYLYYQCSSKKYGQAKCKNKSINKNSFENFILKSINNHIITEKNLMTLADDTNRILKAKYESEKLKKDILKKRLQILKVRINNTQNMLADNDLEDQKVGFSMLGDFRKEENEIQDQLAQIGDITFIPLEKSDIMDVAQKTRGNLRMADFDKKRNFVQSFIQKITVMSDRKILIEYDFLLAAAGNAVRTVGVNHGSSPTLYAPRPGLEPGTR